MADYFAKFSLLVPQPSQAAQQYALALAKTAENAVMADAPPLDDFPADLREVIEDWRFEAQASPSPDEGSLWLSSEYGGVDAVCAFVQHLLRKFDPQGRVSFEWSNNCSKPRVDAQWGGAALITAQEIKTVNTGQWLREQVANVLPELVAAREVAEKAVEYYDETWKGCPVTLKAVRDALQNAHHINPPLAPR